MASKLGGDPIGSRLNTEVVFAESGSILVVPLRSWKYAVLVVTTRWQYHLCTCLQINPRKIRAILSDLFTFFFHLICHASLFCSVLFLLVRLHPCLAHMNNFYAGLQPSFIYIYICMYMYIYMYMYI